MDRRWLKHYKTFSCLPSSILTMIFRFKLYGVFLFVNIKVLATKTLVSILPF